jgi:hypothetical protein
VRGDLVTLELEGWFDNGQRGEGCFLWSPPPAAANIVTQQLGVAHQKCLDCLHITVVPRLMTARWRKSLVKEADLIVELPAGNAYWSAECMSH